MCYPDRKDALVFDTMTCAAVELRELMVNCRHLNESARFLTLRRSCSATPTVYCSKGSLWTSPAVSCVITRTPQHGLPSDQQKIDAQISRWRNVWLKHLTEGQSLALTSRRPSDA